jgi:hypothetical protein
VYFFSRASTSYHIRCVFDNADPELRAVTVGATRKRLARCRRIDNHSAARMLSRRPKARARRKPRAYLRVARNFLRARKITRTLCVLVCALWLSCRHVGLNIQRHDSPLREAAYNSGVKRVAVLHEMLPLPDQGGNKRIPKP